MPRKTSRINQQMGFQDNKRVHLLIDSACFTEIAGLEIHLQTPIVVIIN